MPAGLQSFRSSSFVKLAIPRDAFGCGSLSWDAREQGLCPLALLRGSNDDEAGQSQRFCPRLPPVPPVSGAAVPTQSCTPPPRP